MVHSLKSTAKRIPLLGPLLQKAYLSLKGEGKIRPITTGHLAGLKYHQYRWSTPNPDLVQTNWDDPLPNAFIHHIKNKKRFYDIGANWGFYVLLASKHKDPHCQIVAFEPHPQSAKELESQITLNQITSALVIQAALSDQSGHLQFADTGSAIGQKLATLNDSPQSAQTITVPTMTLDQATQQFGPPDLIKLDVEGAENLVIAGGHQTLQHHRPTLLVEIHGQDRATPFYTKMHHLHYQCQTPTGEPVTNQAYHHHLICLPT